MKKEKRDAAVTVSLTKKEKDVMEELAAASDSEVAVIARRMIKHFLASSMTLQELLQTYDAESIVGKFEKNSAESRVCRICIRFTRNEMQKLNALAGKHYYFPGTAARILLELLLEDYQQK